MSKRDGDWYDKQVEKLARRVCEIAEDQEKLVLDVVHDLDHYIIEDEKVQELYWNCIGYRIKADKMGDLTRSPVEYHNGDGFEFSEAPLKDRVKDDLRYEVEN